MMERDQEGGESGDSRGRGRGRSSAESTQRWTRANKPPSASCGCIPTPGKSSVLRVTECQALCWDGAGIVSNPHKALRAR